MYVTGAVSRVYYHKPCLRTVTPAIHLSLFHWVLFSLCNLHSEHMIELKLIYVYMYARTWIRWCSCNPTELY